MPTVIVAGRRYQVWSQTRTADPAVDRCTLVPVGWWSLDRAIVVELEVTW